MEPIKTFDNFIEGPSNKFAYTVAKEVARNPGKLNTPFLLHGKSGLGKSHLLSAIAIETKKNFPDFNIMKPSAESFYNEFMKYFENDNVNDFINKYLQVNMLLIDDFDCIENDEIAQTTLINILERLIKENNIQVVITFHDYKGRTKKRLKYFIEILPSGYLADLQIPNFELRNKIANKICKEEKALKKHRVNLWEF